jgi:hypothetical protein
VHPDSEPRATQSKRKIFKSEPGVRSGFARMLGCVRSVLYDVQVPRQLDFSLSLIYLSSRVMGSEDRYFGAEFTDKFRKALLGIQVRKGYQHPYACRKRRSLV